MADLYFVVRLEDAGDSEQITIISGTWLRENATKTVLPNVKGTKYYQHVRDHSQIDLSTDLIPITIFLSTKFFNHAREQEVEVVNGRIGSSDATVTMGLPVKRRIIPTTFSSDDDYRPKLQRINAPKYRPIEAPSSLLPTQPMDAHGSTSTANLDVSTLLAKFDIMMKSFTALSNLVSKAVMEMNNNLISLMDRLACSTSSRFIVPLPMKSLTEVLNFEARIADEDFAEILSRQLQRLLGKSLRGLVSNILHQMFSKEAVLQFTYAGFHSSFSFKRSKLARFVIDQVQLRPQYANQSTKEIGAAIRHWFHLNRDQRNRSKPRSIVQGDTVQNPKDTVDLDVSPLRTDNL